ncbi:hypothetical protein V1J52_16050 [Streptomyces sp. TRM 70351]|uniref:hypothetical protein n=1 Tax=Streptomyces sp. TRM 70351 TaxID=3116552 RepID=UPI002E7AECF5|nr:hypothetical protein [Streptomyces sp. TRM 70351]MEE1929680.1 hypothetical protein [Streptomyces sp. TRM 70351]
MSWWLRAHAVTGAAAAMVLCFAVAPLLGSSRLPVPSLFGGVSGGIPVPLVLPVLPAGALLYGLHRVPHACEATAVRRTGWWSTGLLAAACSAALLLGAAEQVWLDFPLAGAVARNTVGYLGFGLLVQRLLGAQYGPVAVALVPLGCALLGTGAGGRPYPWAWPLLPGGSAPAWGTAVALLATGAFAAFHTPKAHPAPSP